MLEGVAQDSHPAGGGFGSVLSVKQAPAALHGGQRGMAGWDSALDKRCTATAAK